MNRFRNSMFISAVLFTLGALSVSFDSTGVQWMWAQTPIVGVVLAVFGLSFGVVFVRFLRKGAPT